MKFLLTTPFLASLMAASSMSVAEATDGRAPLNKNNAKRRTKPRANPRATPHQRVKPNNGPNLIVGGEQSEVGDFPYYVDMNGCGGSLIAPGVVLSAAHCGSYAGSSVIVGGYERGEVTSDAVQANILESAIHPQYDSSNFANDFMLHRLEDTVSMDHTKVQLLLNDDPTLPFDGQDLTVLGLGAQYEGGYLSDVLMDVKVPVVNTDQCNAPSSYAGAIIDDVMFCAGYEEGGKDSCQGDSGGPIVIRNGDQHIQVGVVSWGYGCAQENLPGVYATVSSSMDWIKGTVCGCWGMTDSPLCAGSTDIVCPPKPTCAGIDNFDAGYGGCDTYGPGMDNHAFCTLDFDYNAGVAASEACSECGACEGITTSGVECVDIDNYDAGYGGCETYALGLANHDWCSLDVDANGVVAEDACSECGQCSRTGTPESCQDMPSFSLGVAIMGFKYDCDWFAMYEPDHGICAIFGHAKDSNGNTANEACCACAEL